MTRRPTERRRDGRGSTSGWARRARAARSISRSAASCARANASQGDCACMVLTSFRCLVVVIGLVLVDVVVEGAAGVGHEHVFETRLASEPLGRQGLELVRGAFGDDPTVVEDRDPGAEA